MPQAAHGEAGDFKGGAGLPKPFKRTQRTAREFLRPLRCHEGCLDEARALLESESDKIFRSHEELNNLQIMPESATFAILTSTEKVNHMWADDKKLTSLMLASRFGQLNAVKTLIQNNVDVNAKSADPRDTCTALTMACEEGRF